MNSSLLWADALAASTPLRRLASFDFVDSMQNRSYARITDEALDEILKGAKGRPLDQSKRRFACSLTGRMAFGYAFPWSRFYKDEKLKEMAKARLLAIAESQDETGAITSAGEIFGSERADNHGSVKDHETAWNLEPLILAALWLGEALNREEQALVQRMVRRAVEAFAAHPYYEVNNREICRCAVIAMGGRFLNDERLVATAKEQFQKAAIRIFSPTTGQIFEGSGPDGNYSTVSAIYGFLYQLFVEDEELEARLGNTARWITWAMDHEGYPITFGNSTRYTDDKMQKVSRYLPLLERAAAKEPHLRWLIDNVYAPHLAPIPFAADTFCYAMLAHQKLDAQENPGWFRREKYPDYLPAAGPEFGHRNEGVDSLHFIVRESYLTSVGIMGRMPFKGMQHWGYDGEPPILWPTMKEASRTVALGIDTASMNVSGSKTRDKIWREGCPSTLVARWNKVWQFYIFTPETTVLAIVCNEPHREDYWIIGGRCQVPQIEANSLVYPQRRGRLFWAPGIDASLETEGDYMRLRAGKGAVNTAYAFSDKAFKWGDGNLAEGKLAFTDSSGSYTVEFAPPPASVYSSKSLGYAASFSATARIKVVKVA